MTGSSGPETGQPNGEGPWMQGREAIEVWEAGGSLAGELRAFRVAAAFTGTRGIPTNKCVLANRDVVKGKDGSSLLLDT